MSIPFPAGIPSPDAIEAEHQRLGHRFGWRLLTCPARNIETASVALITINPGGAHFEEPIFSVEAGSAYALESWKGRPPGSEKLQQQVVRMFEVMRVAPQDVLSGYLVPFRSRDWTSLPSKQESIKFGTDIWTAIWAVSKASKVIGFGKEIGPHLTSILGASLHTGVPAGWGDQSIDIYRFRGIGRLLILPHLSRFGLFHRPNSEAAFQAALNL